MKKYLNLATALIASLKPKSKIPIIDSYGQSTLNQEQQQALMEWLFASLMGAGYFGSSHLIWDGGQDREREIFTALMRNEPIFLYRQGARPSQNAEGYCWQLIGEHPSLCVYQLVVEVEGE
ncbi:MAG: hypothetical protein JGK17_29410 [Microcoleus sp. PH2017_10_PVI_O_A]|uniref:hypothetical protein n=1 Tax=unclassified Microcoleus TaxID=2642155 RepID=UPI001D61371F|nr:MULTISPECIES: hypothetical protein [unclassified Microcoleus]MCC3409599.1 hypothetical protein [Microcoleus sp. PH2017_10_PVI_O_A]MCC3463849.1 hypothetical protein [Microcoleus sp. PH2017_11_PCY_U_A]MCC3482200.1 hypothetical protein [Microcoleus sp. PH2017_12_PCY_D_A]MCC3532285.1 hypothetical protein [Microcoleus sp. PH2017_21_RUC_O_A]MCC3544568.1 hypothetical protein [Microcoleus sp. PH2017_22_RUC_O_B]